MSLEMLGIMGRKKQSENKANTVENRTRGGENSSSTDIVLAQIQPRRRFIHRLFTILSNNFPVLPMPNLSWFMTCGIKRVLTLESIAVTKDHQKYLFSLYKTKECAQASCGFRISLSRCHNQVKGNG